MVIEFQTQQSASHMSFQYSHMVFLQTSYSMLQTRRSRLFMAEEARHLCL